MMACACAVRPAPSSLKLAAADDQRKCTATVQLCFLSVCICSCLLLLCRCRVCLQNHFCNGGEANVTGACTEGYSCRGGILQLKRGFWSPINPSEWQQSSTLIAYKCPNDAACAGGDYFGHITRKPLTQCTAGSEGVLCNECAVGSVLNGGTCINCHSSVLSVFAILILPTSVLLIITVLTAVLLQETSGKSHVSAARG